MAADLCKNCPTCRACGRSKYYDAPARGELSFMVRVMAAIDWPRERNVDGTDYW